MKTIAVVGLGYVGLGLALALNKHYPVIGYDINTKRIRALRDHEDSNELFDKSLLSLGGIDYTDQIDSIKKANFYIITVSTPSYFYEMPNLEPLINATTAVAHVIKEGDIIVFESTVYPGTTEEVCLPILEKISGLSCGKAFTIGYSPERINPHDTEHTLYNTTKIIAAQTKDTLENMKEVYGQICQHVYPVSCIRAAEAVKDLENTQRDVNIALMNEFAQIMHALDLDVHEIIEAAKTKWSFIPFKPGFVGGHCIPVDPHYLAFKAKRVSVDADLILTARKINDNMPRYVVQEMIKLLIKNDIPIKGASIGVFGLSYKENSKDVRNSLALKLIRLLESYGFNLQLHDPLLSNEMMQNHYDMTLTDWDDIHDLSVAIIVAQHDFYREIGLTQFMTKSTKHPMIMIDIPNLFVEKAKKTGKMIYWSL